MSLTAKEDKTLAYLLRHMAAVREHWSTVVAIKEGLRREDGLMVKEAWQELTYEQKVDLWTAKTKGGIWEPWERKAIDAVDSLTTAHQGLLSFQIHRHKPGSCPCHH